jgi:hypothetical protein
VECQLGLAATVGMQAAASAPDVPDQVKVSAGAVVGHHYAGPTWKHNDGSEVTGKASAKVDSSHPDSIPWLLVTATEHSGAGVFAHTTGGQAPAAASCDCSKLASRQRSRKGRYFYAPAK